MTRNTPQVRISLQETPKKYSGVYKKTKTIPLKSQVAFPEVAPFRRGKATMEASRRLHTRPIVNPESVHRHTGPMFRTNTPHTQKAEVAQSRGRKKEERRIDSSRQIRQCRYLLLIVIPRCLNALQLWRKTTWNQS